MNRKLISHFFITLPVAILFVALTTQPAFALSLQHLGTEYGGWTIPSTLLNADSICYCVGAGEDISFDIALINTFNCRVFCFDPTPKAIAHIEQIYKGFALGKNVPINHGKIYYHLDDPSAIQKLIFFTYGLWNTNTTINFYFPKNPNHASCSALNLQNTTDYVPVTCKTVSTIMQELAHTHIDLLKLDIEGAEYPVIDNMLAEHIFPSILCIEFHPTKEYEIPKYFTSLKNVGYALVNQKGHDATFVYQISTNN